MISAVVPVFNAEKTLIRSVESLISQPEIDEIFLVEDGSQDGSLQLCLSLAKKYPLIKVLQHPGGINKGAPGSRNLGLSMVKNKWVQFMDADGELMPGKISDQIGCINGDEAVVVGKFTTFEEHAAIQLMLHGDVWLGLIATRLGITVSNLWNAEWIRKAGNWDESLPNMQEYYLMFEILKRNGKFVFSEGNLTRIYPQPNSISNSSEDQEIKRDNYFIFRQRVKEYLISIGEYNLRRKHHFEVCTGTMLRYHQPPFPVHYNKLYYTLYRNLKNLLA